MALPVQRLHENLSVAPQLTPEHMAAVAAAGYKSVIINRPDFEEGPHQPTSADLMQAAQEAGLEIVYQPVVSGSLTAADVQRFGELLETLPTPILAFCRSGTRCTVLFRAVTGQV